MSQAQPYTQAVATSTFHLPSPPSCTNSLNLLYLRGGHVPLLQLPFEPVKATPVPFHFHGCAFDPVPIVTTLAAGHATPVLASPLLLMPENKIISTLDGLEHLKHALFLAGQGAYAPGRGVNPLAGGTLNMRGCVGPFLYKPAEKIGAQEQVDAVGGDAAAHCKGKGAAQELPEHVVADTVVQALPRDTASMVISDSESELGDPPTKLQRNEVLTYQRRRSERIRRMQDGVRLGSVERASQRKPSFDEGSSASQGTATRRRKTRRIPDINVVAPMPITETPPASSRQALIDLASCCGLLNVEQVLKNKRKNVALESSRFNG